MIYFKDAKSLEDHFTIVFADSHMEWLTAEVRLLGDDKKIIESYHLGLSFHLATEERFPKVVELSRKITFTDSRHINWDGTFCLAVEAEEILECRSGLTFEQFIWEVLLPFLANQVRLEKGYSKSFHGHEYEHGLEGILQFYKLNLKDVNERQIPFILNYLIQKGVSKNRKCPCESGRNIKNCHSDQLNYLMRIGKDQLEIDRDRIHYLLNMQANNKNTDL